MQRSGSGGERRRTKRHEKSECRKDKTASVVDPMGQVLQPHALTHPWTISWSTGPGGPYMKEGEKIYASSV